MCKFFCVFREGMLRWAWLLVATLLIAAGAPGSSVANCGEGCRVITTDGTDPAAPALFQEALLDPEVNQVVLDAPRYQLKSAAWAKYGGDNLVVLNRNLTIRSTVKPFGLMDFQQLERKILINPGVTVMFESIVLQNVRKLGGFALEMFVGEKGSQIILNDVVRVKLACQLPQDVLRAARSFKRVSEQFPPNSVSLLPEGFCFVGALDASYKKQEHCFRDALHLKHFSMQASSNDPDAGRQFPGYILYNKNTTIVCQHTITEACVEQHGDEVCLAMLISNFANNREAPSVWTKGAIAGVAVAGGVVALALLCCCYFRRHLLVWFVQLDGNGLQELEGGSSQWVTQHALPCALGQLQGGDDGFEGKGMEYSWPGYTGRAISQQVTLGVLLGAGSFGRVYKGRWHSSDVAIKIMSCTRADLPKVLREAEVMMQLNHPNIVRAFHASVWNPAEQMRALQAREARRSSSSSIKKRSSFGRSSSFRAANAPAAAAAATTMIAATTANACSVPLPPSSSVDCGSCGNDQATERDAAEVSSGANAAATSQHGTSGNSLSIGSGLAAVGGQPAAAAPNGVAGARSATPCGIPPMQQQGQAAASSSAATASGHALNDDQKLVSSWGSAAPLSSLSTGGMAAAGSMQNGTITAPAGCSSSSNVAAFSSSFVSSSDVAAALSAQQMAVAVSQPLSMSSGGGSTGHASGATPSVARAEKAGRTTGSNAQDSNGDANNLAAADPKPQGSFKQHLITRLVRNSSGSSQQISVESSAAAVSSGGGAAATAALPAIKPGRSSDSNQQQGSSGCRPPKQQQQEQQQAGPRHQSGDTPCAEVQVWIVLELCSAGTLKDAVSSGRMVFDDTAGLHQVLSRLLETANGMAYLHSKGVLHGDLKAGNVLLQNVHATGQQVAKISDFGLAAVLLDGATHRSTASMGTITHMAPEVLRSGHMSPAADVYSFGIMMWEVFTRQQAYQGLHFGAVVERVVIQKHRPPIPDDMPEEFSLLMCACWDAEPNNRPSFMQIAKCLEIMLGNLAVDQSGAIDEAQDWQCQGANRIAGRHVEHVDPNALHMTADTAAKCSAAAAAAAASPWPSAQEQPWPQQQWQQQAAYAGVGRLPSHVNVSGDTGMWQVQNQLHTSGSQPTVFTPPQQGPKVHVLVGPAGDTVPGGMGIAGFVGQPIVATTTRATTSTQSHSGPASQQSGSGSNILDENPYLGDF